MTDGSLDKEPEEDAMNAHEQIQWVKRLPAGIPYRMRFRWYGYPEPVECNFSRDLTAAFTPEPFALVGHVYVRAGLPVNGTGCIALGLNDEDFASLRPYIQRAAIEWLLNRLRENKISPSVLPGLPEWVVN